MRLIVFRNHVVHVETDRLRYCLHHLLVPLGSAAENVIDHFLLQSVHDHRFVQVLGGLYYGRTALFLALKRAHLSELFEDALSAEGVAALYQCVGESVIKLAFGTGVGFVYGIAYLCFDLSEQALTLIRSRKEEFIKGTTVLCLT